MTTKKISVGMLSLGLMLAVSLTFSGCKTKETEPEIPNFEEGYGNVKPLPTVTVSTPATVTSTPASVATSAATDAVNSGLAGGALTPALSQASEDIGKAVSPAKASELVNAFTPSLLETLKSGGALPASLKSEMDALQANASLATYMPKVTPATVNGKNLSGALKNSKSEPSFKLEDLASVAAINSACTDAAQAAYNTAKKILDDSKAANELIVNNAFNPMIAAVNSDACKTTATNAANTSVTQANATLEAGLAGINAGITNGTYSEAIGLNLKMFVYVGYTAQLQAIESARVASVSGCDAASAAQIAAINAAKTSDLASIQASYTAALAPLNTTLSNNMKTCHDQGMGGN